MARLPFNPEHVPAPPAASRNGPMTVTELSELVKRVVAAGIPAKVRVVGEVSNFSNRAHWFFSMKDEGACIRCVCFASAARRVGFDLRDGMQVVATGRIDYYEAQGSLQLYVDAIEPVGQGALELRFQQLCEDLRKLGYFEESRKKPLPAMPCKVAVVTSRTAAALQDVINTAGKRWAGCRLMLYDVRVQGAEAAPEIAAALTNLARQGRDLGIDAVLLVRGGGSIEDLWAFNERIVADAIYRCPIPVVAAIGHETDTTIAELVADLRCSTPTQAAMHLIPDRAGLEQQLVALRQRLTTMLRRSAQHRREHLEQMARYPVFRRPRRLLEAPMARVETLDRRLQAGLPRLLGSQRERVAAMTRHLESIAPTNVLKRGYSYTLGPAGQVLRSADQVAPRQTITTVLAEGRLSSRVLGEDGSPPPADTDAGAIVPAPATPAPTRPAPTRRLKRRAAGGDQPGLFESL